MSDTPEITLAVKEARITQAEAERIAGLNARTIKKIFKGETVSSRSEARMREGLNRHRSLQNNIEGLLSSDAVSNIRKAFDHIEEPQDALALLRAFRKGFDDFVRSCMDKDLGFTPSDARRFEFEINGLKSSAIEINRVATQRYDASE